MGDKSPKNNAKHNKQKADTKASAKQGAQPASAAPRK